MGTIVIELDATKAPGTVKNFLQYVDDGFYDGTVFHRVIPTFMIQGGGLVPELKEKPARAPIKNEATNGLKNLRGTVAMARKGDPDSATAQFYINVQDNASLNHPRFDPRTRKMGWGYCVFGKVTEGMDVVDKIKAVATGSAEGQLVAGQEADGSVKYITMPLEDVPREPVIIRSVKRKQI